MRDFNWRFNSGMFAGSFRKDVVRWCNLYLLLVQLGKKIERKLFMKIISKNILAITIILALINTPFSNNVSAISIKKEDKPTTEEADSKNVAGLSTSVSSEEQSAEDKPTTEEADLKDTPGVTPFVSSGEQDAYAKQVSYEAVSQNARKKLFDNSTLHSKVGSSYTIDLGDSVTAYGEEEDWKRANGKARINSIKLDGVENNEKIYGNYKVSVAGTSLTVTRVSEEDSNEDTSFNSIVNDLRYNYEWNIEVYGWYPIVGWMQENDRVDYSVNYLDKINLGSALSVPEAGVIYENYLDVEGNVISEQTTQENLLYFDEYVSEPKKIENYTLVTTPENITGYALENATTINYVYKKDGPTLSFEKTAISNKTFDPSNGDEQSLKQVAAGDAITITNDYIVDNWDDNQLVQEMLIPKHSNITTVELNGMTVSEDNIVISDNNATTKKATIMLPNNKTSDTEFKLDVKLMITDGFDEKEQVILDKAQNVLKEADNEENSVTSPSSLSLEMTTNTLSFDTEDIDFGTNQISAKSVVLNRVGEGPVIKINDTRRSLTHTKLTVSSEAFTNQLEAEVFYHDANGAQTTLDTPVYVMDEKGDLPSEINWGKDEGLLLHVPAGAAMKGDYTNTLHWNILMIPGEE